MIDAIKSILDVITTLINFLINTVTSLISLITQIPTYTALLIESINFLPRFVIPFSLAFISLIVVQYILNRRV